MVKQTNIDALVKNARCPRCGYDLRGIMETWEQACDISGTCSECGLEYEWGDLLNPARNMPKWCVEYSAGPLATMRAFFSTALMMLRPWRFWSELGMHHQPRWRRHAVLAGLLLITLVVIFELMLGLYTWGSLVDMQAKVSGTIANMSEVIFKTMLLPFSQDSLGIVNFNQGSYVISPPLQVSLRMLANGYGVGVEVIPILLLYTVLCPVGFLALPQSRRITKVRWVHVLRIGVYSFFFVWLFVVISLICSLADSWWRFVPITFGLPQITVTTAYLSLYIVILIWWSLATSRYLKMKHAWGVGVAVCVMSWIVTMLIYLYTEIDPKLW
ncbi:MAG: hypothetical protein IID30_15350 [Planctomycetes bacterium]|nr:hypothetical protein [Planctomycetota bacterium]